MAPIDRIIWMPILNLFAPLKSEYKGCGGKEGHESGVVIKSLRHSVSLNDAFGTGCDKHDDCFTCPEELYKECSLGKGNGKKR